jgi:hypothetical protein
MGTVCDKRKVNGMSSDLTSGACRAHLYPPLHASRPRSCLGLTLWHHALQGRVDDSQERAEAPALFGGQLGAATVAPLDPGVQRVGVAADDVTVRPSLPVSGGATGTPRSARSRVA